MYESIRCDEQLGILDFCDRSHVMNSDKGINAQFIKFGFMIRLHDVLHKRIWVAVHDVISQVNKPLELLIEPYRR